MQRRDILSIIIFSIITCGIYNIYWIVKTQDELNAYEGTSHNNYSGIVVILLSIITCGIYLIYWYYSLPQRLLRYGIDSNLPLISLILCIFGLALVSSLLIQNEINNKIVSQ